MWNCGVQCHGAARCHSAVQYHGVRRCFTVRHGGAILAVHPGSALQWVKAVQQRQGSALWFMNTVQDGAAFRRTLPSKMIPDNETIYSSWHRTWLFPQSWFDQSHCRASKFFLVGDVVCSNPLTVSMCYDAATQNVWSWPPFNYNSSYLLTLHILTVLTNRNRGADGLPWWSPSQVLATKWCRWSALIFSCSNSTWAWPLVTSSHEWNI